MNRPIGIFVVITITAVACGGAAVSQPAAPAVSPTEQATTSAPAVVAQPAATSAGPAAPDFLMELDDGDIYVLSRDQKPIYMVFWAEW